MTEKTGVAVWSHVLGLECHVTSGPRAAVIGHVSDKLSRSTDNGASRVTGGHSGQQ